MAKSTKQPRRPRLAVVVANAITGDSRVQKTALTAAHDGWDVLLIGQSRTKDVERTWMGPVKVLRVPVGDELRRQETVRRRTSLVQRTARAGLVTKRDVTWARAQEDARARRRDAKRAQANQVAQLGLRAVGRADRDLLRWRLRAREWSDTHLPDAERALGDWRRDVPVLLDLDRALGPAIEEFRPDVVHANDITALYPVATAITRMRDRGHQVRWLYDAHEYVAGVEWPTARMVSGYPQVEHEFIHAADAVVTVSPEIAEVIRDEHHLSATPLVVRNVPIRAAVGQARDKSVRAAVGLADDVPLLVYSGYIQAERGLDTAVLAMPSLPGVHLAIVANVDNPETRKLLAIAQTIGVGDRVHLAPYVDQHEVPDYLSTADVGIILSKRTINYELSLPTKFAEYLHAGLPVVVSDVKTLSRYVRDHGVGEVFTSGDPVSFGEAVQAAFADPDRYRAKITEESLSDLSWETQAAGLLQLYRDLAGTTPPPAAQPPSWELSERFRKGGRHGRVVATEDTLEDDHPWRRLTKRTPVRLGLGPANYAGQLAAIAQAVTRHRGDVSAEVTMHVGGASFGYPADVYATNASLGSLDVQIAHLRRTLPHYTHLIADAFRPVFGTLNGDDIAGDLPALRRARIKVALLAHGSEIRVPDRHRERSPESHFHDVPDADMLERLNRAAKRNQEILASLDLPVYVTTPDLLEDAPGATWLPLVVDVDAWATDNPVMERSRPVVLHAPSKRWTKGTDRFLPGLEKLADAGLIELDLVEGLPWAQMQEHVKAADIVVDQVAVGAYGAFACEAMAAGKPVIAYLSDGVTAAVGADLPIVNARGADVAEAVERLVADRDGTRAVGAASARFAREMHDGRRTATLLDRFLR